MAVKEILTDSPFVYHSCGKRVLSSRTGVPLASKGWNPTL